MLDIKWIRENPEKLDDALFKRNLPTMSKKILELDLQKRNLTASLQELQHQRKHKSKLLSTVDKNSAEFEAIKQEVELINDKLNNISTQLDLENELENILNSLPNFPFEEVPIGKDESFNKEIKSYGIIPDIKNPKEHFELGEALGLMEFEQTVKMSGSRFVSLIGDLAKLERALTWFMIDCHVKEFGYTEISPPYLVKNHAMYNVGQLPKFAEDSFLTTNEYRLIPTAEVSLTNFVADTIVPREKLPMRLTAYTPCFRSEAGSAGRDTKGMIRVHQFGKVEMVSICAQEESADEHEDMLAAAENILQKLELPYRVMLLSSGDMGFSSHKTYDLEVWLPGQKKYREISSVSNCGAFQARRMKARYKEFGANETKLVHTLNGSGLAVGRTIVAILENYQNQDGSINLPKALVPYMGGVSKIY
jgi:seryl-tRNA synthetase